MTRRLSLALLAGMLGGCVKPPPPPITAKLPLPSLRVHDAEEITQEGMTISVTPITTVNVRRYPQLHKLITVEVPQRDAAGNVTSTTAQVTTTIVPMPAFQVRIANNTGHVVRFTGTVFRLQDNTGRTFQTFGTTAELHAWHAGTLARDLKDPAVQAQVMQQAAPAFTGLQLLNRNVELLKGDEWVGYLVFNLETDTKESYSAFFNAIERLSVRIAEVPVQTNDAGQVSKVAEFTFIVDKTSEEVDAQCPGDTVTPSWQLCTRVQ
ncbi:MAG: hypothetical protein KJZ91_01670 [Myxococcales bacterium]|nr:hypothetical protein [Myxococcales bacterium]